MYLDFFSFSERPFDVTPDTRFLYPSPQHEAAIETLRYGIRERRGFMVLTGEVGTGKTTSIRQLLNSMEEKVETALIINPLISTLELLQSITRDFGLDTGSAVSIQEQIGLLNHFLLETDRKGKIAAVIIDEAQNLSLEALEMVRLLSNLETETHKLLQIILVGQPELDSKLNQEALRQLRQRIQIRYFLGPLSRSETQAYILHRIRKASPKCCLVFNPEALERIHNYTSGIPRLINTLCELTLLAAYTRETHMITKKIVEIAFHELNDKSWVKPHGKLISMIRGRF
ncbi:MAG: AAA family ATPase [Deltaproteobacteria bacterium]|nr:AAA family ATPase [Deltaproteobacteria bacterium]MBI2501546.1 AAA family ATPase [Deltaproteobacteria bacterium]